MEASATRQVGMKLSATTYAAIALCIALCVAHTRAMAQERWGGSVAVTSDYRVRGLTQSLGNPAVQAGVHTQLHPGWVIGVWASSIERVADRTRMEVDAYTGFTWTFSDDWSAKFGFTHYAYPNDPARSSYDYDELNASLVFRSLLAATVTWSPNSTYFGWYRAGFQAERGASATYELASTLPLTSSLSLVSGAGYNDVKQLFDAGYWYWNAGLSWSLGPVQLDLSWIDTDATARRLFGARATDATWSAALAWRF